MDTGTDDTSADYVDPLTPEERAKVNERIAKAKRKAGMAKFPTRETPQLDEAEARKVAKRLRYYQGEKWGWRFK